MEFNNALIEEREQGILEIQQQIGEVNEIFQDLAVLVNEQGQMIDDIEADIVSTAVRTKDAQRELTKADKSQRERRETEMICLAVVIAVVLIILIPFPPAVSERTAARMCPPVAYHFKPDEVADRTLTLALTPRAPARPGASCVPLRPRGQITASLNSSIIS